jgi:hypothetical protein
MLEPEKLNSTLTEKKSGSLSSQDGTMLQFGVQRKASIKVSISGTEIYT